MTHLPGRLLSIIADFVCTKFEVGWSFETGKHNSVLALMPDPTIKGLVPSETSYDGSNLRIAIVHARWNKSVIDSLVAGAVAKLKASGVKESNIVIQTVPGSFELPLACSK